MQVQGKGSFFEICTDYTKCFRAKKTSLCDNTSMKLDCVQNDGQLSLCTVIVYKVPENFFMVTLYVFPYFPVNCSHLLWNSRTGIYSLSHKYLKSYWLLGVKQYSADSKVIPHLFGMYYYL